MATIRKQSLYSSLFIYLGFAFGAFNVLYLFPKFFTPEQFGLTRIIMDITMIFSTVITAGILPIVYKFSPFYRGYLPKEKNDLTSIVFLYLTIAYILFLIALPYLKPIILRKFGKNSPLLLDYFHLVIPFTISLALFSVLESLAWIIKKAVLTNFLRELTFRLITMVLILCWALGWINQYDTFITIYTNSFFISIVILIVFLFRSNQFQFQFTLSNLSKRLYPLMIKFGGAYFLSAVFNIIARTNDTLIIASQSTGGLIDAAIFTIATYLITIMDVPQRSLVGAAVPQIAEAWKDHDLKKLDRLYKKTALNLLIIGLAIMGVVLINIPILLKFLGPTYIAVPQILIILGISKLIDLGTGLNSQILQLSKHWKIDLFTNIFFVIVSVFLNYILTKRFGIIGTAYGGLIAIIAFNLTRFIYIKNIYKLQPFTWNNLITLAVSAILYIGIDNIPIDINIWANAIIKTSFFISLFSLFIIKFNISNDLTELVSLAMSKLNTTKKEGQ
jgi:O-antigen/teichoic acid export membrane protein